MPGNEDLCENVLIYLPKYRYMYVLKEVNKNFNPFIALMNL